VCTVREVLEFVEAEYRRYKELAEKTFAQLSESELASVAAAEGNSVAMLVWHISGNLRSRFTEFLTTDADKPWRRRDEEFDPRRVSHGELRQRWEEGWGTLESTLAGLSDADLSRPVLFRGQSLTVADALYRSLAHTSYHVGQIVFLGKTIRSGEWQCLSIPRSPKKP
jgi:uncharacterized damage-inducible protein DinB